jgi:hypothetical protein
MELGRELVGRRELVVIVRRAVGSRVGGLVGVAVGLDESLEVQSWY